MDELELANPLGAFKSIHKVSCFYWQILNLNAHHKSALQSIQPCNIAYCDAVKDYLNVVFQPLFDDLLKLETEGVYVERINKTLKGTLAIISGDNLSSNLIGGFSNGFGNDNGKTCRNCLI